MYPLGYRRIPLGRGIRSDINVYKPCFFYLSKKKNNP